MVFDPYGNPALGGMPGTYSRDAENVATIQQLRLLDSERVATIQQLLEQDADRVFTIQRLQEQDANRAATIQRLQEQDADKSATIQRLLEQDADRVITIQRLQEQDTDRVATIQRLQEQDADRVATIQRLQEQDIGRVATIQQLQEQDVGRVSTIDLLMEQDASGAATVQRLTELDSTRVSTINRASDDIARLLASLKEMSKRFYETDGMIASDRNMEFMDEPVFAEAWRKSREASVPGWPAGVPDVRWRAAIALWAARACLSLKGDFVECGVHTGLLSLVILNALDFGKKPRPFYLFDTFDGIPLEGLEGEELVHAKASNADIYTDVWGLAQKNFAPYKNARLVRGKLPGTLDQVKLGPIAYLSMDLNVAATEEAVMECLWDLLVPGAIVVVDDYGWIACKAQYEMWNAFANERGHYIAPLPTGQGLLIKR